ncbi:putative Myo-inositol transporter 1 [Aureobasidium subglaciale]|nr:putative Myo-inositol transporter 1 [Aureobasidium subglaciale]
MRTCYGRGAPLRWAVYLCCLSAFLFFGYVPARDQGYSMLSSTPSYDQGVLGGILENPDFRHQFGELNDTITGITVTSYCLGALFGCVINFSIGDILGRRKMIWLAMAFIIVGAVLQTSAYTLTHLIIGRIITGLGTGIDSSTVPMYQSELSRPEWRGRQVSWEVLFVGVGIVLAYWIDYGFSYIDGPVSWRTPIAIQLVFAIIITVLVWGLPESPRWLAKAGRMDEALEVICAVYDLSPEDEYVRLEMESMRQTIILEAQEGTQKWTSVFQNDALKTRRRVLLAFFGLFFNQMSGINLVVYYLPTVMTENVGLSRNTALLVAGFVQLMFPIGSLLPAFALDRIGRRWTMIIGCGGLCVCMAMISALLSQGKGATSSAAIAFFFLYMLIFGGTLNVVPWVYVSLCLTDKRDQSHEKIQGPEILPLEASTRGTAISVSAHWIFNFLIVMISPVMINRIGWHTYLVFTCLLFVFCPIIYWNYPETSGLGLEEIDLIFLPEDMGGLDGNARIRLTPQQAAAHHIVHMEGEKDTVTHCDTVNRHIV